MEPNNEIVKAKSKNYLKLHDKIIKDAKLKYDREQMERNISNSRIL